MSDAAVSGRMRAVTIAQPGGPEQLELSERPVPVPGPGELLLRVAAAGVNRPDILQRQGRYPPPPGASDVPGLEVAGEVVAVGAGVMPDLIGQPMCALLNGGGYADYALADARHCLPLPDGMAMTAAAALPETLFTVWHNLFERGYAADGDRVLVHGGTSGIGTMTISLCRAFGVEIIVTCGGAAKCAAARDWGATHAIDYSAEDFAAAVARITRGAGVQVVLDMVGGDYLPRNLACLAEDGRHVSIAVQRGAAAEVNLFDIMRRRLTLTGSTLRARDAGFKALLADEIHAHVWPLVATGQLGPCIDSVYPLAEVAAAHARMEAGEHVGKIVLDCA